MTSINTAYSPVSSSLGTKSAAANFLDYMKKSPEQRMREQILKSMGLTEDDLKNMPPAKLRAVEETIKEKIKEKLEQKREGKSL